MWFLLLVLTKAINICRVCRIETKDLMEREIHVEGNLPDPGTKPMFCIPFQGLNLRASFFSAAKAMWPHSLLAYIDTTQLKSKELPPLISVLNLSDKFTAKLKGG